MAILIKDPETDRIIREIAALTGETLTQVVRDTAQKRLNELRRPEKRIDRAAADRLLAYIHSLPVVDDRSADEILGYDENGLPT